MHWSWWLGRGGLALFLLWLGVGCSTPSGHSPNNFGAGKLGDHCEQTEDCASGLCVRLDDAGGICSNVCQSDGDCPRADNWGCVAATNTNLRVCGCRVLADHELCADGLDNDCDAKVDDCRMCGGQAVSNDDPSNCGACGNACRSDQLCQEQACVCPEGSKDCGGSCVDTSSAVSDCGKCGHACELGQTCSDGACACPSSGDSFCPGAGCVDLDKDQNNCGSCGSGCTLARECSGGKCACPSVDTPDFCDATGCVNLQTDLANCGKCGLDCDAGLVCIKGACICPGGQQKCGDTCVDLQFDEANCGTCGKSCGPQQACIQGSCGCNMAGYKVCGADCVDTSNDTTHCGSCDKACATGERCSSSSCTCQSQLYCDSVCMDAADNANCGACGHACAAGQRCSTGSCVCQGFGLSPCGETCVDFDSDEANCGGCGISCRQGEQCNLGTCACPAGQTYCASAGTCKSLGSDTQNCGACGSACDPTEICSLGSCKCQTSGALYCASQSSCVDTLKNVDDCGGCDQSCKPTEACSGGKCACATSGQVYCASTNACTDTLSNTKHCGGCDKPCRATELCGSGQCRCPGAEQYCDGAKSCVDLANDSTNCGSCDNKCALKQHCASSACACDQAGLTACGAACYDLQSDEAHCGSCNKACDAAFSCLGGSCKCQNPTPGSEVRLLTDANDNYQISAAWDGTNVGVAYVVAADASTGVGYNLYFARVKPDGTLVGTLKVTNFGVTVTGVYERPHLVWNGSEYGVLWVQNIDPGGMPVIMFRRIKPNGTFAAAAVTVAASEVVNQGGFFYTYRVANATLAWSSQYGGYAATYEREGNTGQSVFRRLGVDGTTLEIENTFEELSRNPPTYLESAPDGSWGILSALMLQLINSDGSKTSTASGVNVGMDSFYQPPLLHDGQTFVVAGRSRVGQTSNYGLFLNRGTSTNTPALLLQEAAPAMYTEALLAKAGESIVLGYARAPSQGSGVARLGLQRFAIPGTLTSAVQPLHDAIDIMDADTLSSRGGDAAIVSTTPGHLLSVWADTRWGHKQLYARPIDLHACP